MRTKEEIEAVSSECIIYYTDGSSELCQEAPKSDFQECGPGYGPNRGCPKWECYHKRRK
jgi:hypothetical protein